MGKTYLTEEKEQMRERIREFDRRLEKGMSKGMEPVKWFVILLFEIFIMFFLFLPYENDTIELAVTAAMTLTPWPVWLYLAPYVFVQESGGKMIYIYEKMKYLPVEKREIVHVRLEYLLHFLKRSLVAGVAVQISGAILINGKITLVNILYPVMIAGICPLAIGIMIIWDWDKCG